MTQSLLDEFKPVFSEIHRIVLNCGALYEKTESRSYLSSSLSELSKLFECASIISLKREVVMGLCRIDDDSKNKWSFHEIKKHVNNSGFNQKFVSHTNVQVSAYRKKINIVKTKHRNSYIAHSSQQSYLNQYPSKMELSEELLECVLLAIEVGDFFAAECLEYTWGDVQNDNFIDLRKYLTDIKL